jgi:NADH-quinone oxidoreductase subunit E
VSRFKDEVLQEALELVKLYPEARSATIPLCHLAQSVDGYLAPDAIEHIAELTSTTPAEVHGTASFYDMIQLHPVGRYVVGVCTNIACMLQGGYELLEAVEETMGASVGETSEDSMFTVEEVECIALCDRAPCLHVNYRYFGPLDEEGVKRLKSDLIEGRLEDEVPSHGVISRIKRSAPELIPLEEIDELRLVEDEQRSSRMAQKGGGDA